MIMYVYILYGLYDDRTQYTIITLQSGQKLHFYYNGRLLATRRECCDNNFSPSIVDGGWYTV